MNLDPGWRARRIPAPFRVGDIIRQLPVPGGYAGRPRDYRVTFVNAKAGVFSAEPAGGGWGGWGGPFPSPQGFELVSSRTGGDRG